MSSKSKEKVASIFRKLFKSSAKDEGAVKAGTSNNGSPSRRLLRHRDTVSPATTPGSPAFATGGRKSISDDTHSQSLLVAPSSSCQQQKTVRARRLMKELKDLQRAQTSRENPVFTVDLVDDNLYEWHVRLYRLDSDSDLGRDMRDLALSHILLHLAFPENFPFAPPFMRVITPRIEKGFVMEGGAICMELLTPRGWASAYTVEAIVMQFAASVVKGQGRIQRKAKGSQKVFSRRGAEESFRSLVKTHEKYGWVTPSLADG